MFARGCPHFKEFPPLLELCMIPFMHNRHTCRNVNLAFFYDKYA